ncbi:hypothetical protein LXM94_17870 [Rhizobium sp. TRM95111]|uniref:hypothetical protein n=1 Tax=Rhizobium alarense TaxID=2846851 RepID=UPI001F2F9583|nr:hypothetical protein [Rhizobium alarense]MCF3641843.1 hypothetical protein [Rhizobium alarense]
MSSILTRTLAALALCLGAATAAVPAASAASLDVRVETVGYRHGYHGGHHDGHWGDRPRYDRGYRGRCEPWRAVEKARYHGLRYARVARVTPHRVIVDGRRYGRWATIGFANVPRCPVLWR